MVGDARAGGGAAGGPGRSDGQAAVGDRTRRPDLSDPSKGASCRNT